MFGHLVVMKCKENLLKNMSKYQTARPGHRCQENLYVLKSVMAKNERYGEASSCTLMDLEKFYDKCALIDVLEEAHKNGINDKAYRLLYKMNRRRLIKVATSVGELVEEEVGKGLSQGTLESAILSGGSISNGLEEFFNDSEYELFYIGIRLQVSK